MQKSPRESKALLALVLSALVGGCCPPADFRIETVVHADGSCERTIWQPREGYLPAEAFQADWVKRWESVAGVKNPPGEQPPIPSSGRCDYFVAHGTFRSPDNIPEHYRFVNETYPEAGASELKRRYVVNDPGFVTEHRWREKLTNIVTRADFFKARDELLDIVIRRSDEATEKELGREYDVTALSAYLSGNLRRLAEDLSVVWFDAAAQHRPADETAEALAKVLRSFGIEILPDEKGKLLSDAEAERQMREFGRGIFVKYVRHRDGTPLTAGEAGALADRVMDDHGGKAPTREAGKPLTDEDEKRIVRNALRISGLYGPLAFLFQQPPHYEFALRLPGQLIEANGTIEGADRVRWRFSIDRLYPDGYSMEARSVVIDREAQRKVLGRVVIDDQAAAAEFLDIVGDDGPLLEVVRKLRATGDTNAVRKFHSESADENRRGDRLRAMLLKERK